MYYNYLAAMKEDIREYIDDNGLVEEYRGRLETIINEYKEEQ